MFQAIGLAIVTKNDLSGERKGTYRIMDKFVIRGGSACQAM